MAGDTPHDAGAPPPASNTPDKTIHAQGPQSHAPGAQVPDAQTPGVQAAKHGGLWALTLGAIGVVFGDIGTSPLYALREAIAHAQNGVGGDLAVVGVVSLAFWALMVVVTFKYVFFLMRADNKGEGGTLSLMALAQFAVGRRSAWIFILGV